jgi:hypothetical protein
MIGKHVWTEFPESVDQALFKACYKAVEDQYIYLEKQYIPYEVWFENHIYPSVDGLSIFLEISERKKSDAIIEKEKYFRALVENNQGIMLLMKSLGCV